MIYFFRQKATQDVMFLSVAFGENGTYKWELILLEETGMRG